MWQVAADSSHQQLGAGNSVAGQRSLSFLIQVKFLARVLVSTVVWCIKLVQLVHIATWWSGALQPAAAACCTPLSFTGSEKLSSNTVLHQFD